MSGTGDTDVIAGALKIVGNIDCLCFEDFGSFIKAIPSLFNIEIPSSITNVIVAVDRPDDDQHDSIWFRRSASGSFIGIYVYATGDWRQIFPSPKSIIKMYGDSRAVPAGYALIDAANSHFTAGQVAAIQSSWLPSSDGLAYAVFDVTYEGF